MYDLKSIDLIKVTVTPNLAGNTNVVLQSMQMDQTVAFGFDPLQKAGIDAAVDHLEKLGIKVLGLTGINHECHIVCEGFNDIFGDTVVPKHS